MKLLCFSKDAAIHQQLNDEASLQNWTALVVRNREDVNAEVERFDPDLLLVDVENSEELLWWQGQGLSSQKPVMFLPKELTEEIVVRAFECGADGLLPKTVFTRRSLVARVTAYMKRQGLAARRRVVPRLNIKIDSNKCRVEIKGRQISLTLTEFKILNTLATDEDKIVNRREIQDHVFGKEQVSRRSLDVHVCSLRKKLSPFQLDITSVRGVGYGLVAVR